MSIHALLAADLAIDRITSFSVWRNTLPTLADFNVGLPFMWHKRLQELLPKPARELLEKQQDSFYRDWSNVVKGFPDLSREEYLHSWFIINTRTFYYVTRQMEKYPPIDRLALVPVADLFNHADDGCEVMFTPDGFVISTDRGYRAGQEVFISYGTHTNDFLLVEYGFLPAENRWDKICLDHVILPKLSTTHKEQLRSRGLLCPFMLDCNTLGCKKTQAAVRLLCSCSRGEWQEFLDTEGCGEHCRENMDMLLRSLLAEYLAEVRKAAQEAENLQVGEDVQRKLIIQRWKQIDTTVTRAINRL